LSAILLLLNYSSIIVPLSLLVKRFGKDVCDVQPDNSSLSVRKVFEVWLIHFTIIWKGKPIRSISFA